jgi:hypothetical protein
MYSATKKVFTYRTKIQYKYTTGKEKKFTANVPKLVVSGKNLQGKEIEKGTYQLKFL